MNIIELAKEADIYVAHLNKPMTDKEVRLAFLERFAALVRAEREWVDLTCQEVTALIMEGAAGGGWQGFAERVQAAFKEKNK